MPADVSSVDMDYGALDLEPKPFITYTLKANYKSASVCTDSLGFRQQYFAGDEPVDLRGLRSRYARCRVMLGGSTAFGVKASSDRMTMASFLSKPDLPVVNLALVGAGTQQELAALLALRHLMPEIRDVVLFSGLNECVHAVWRPAAVFSQFGGTAVGAKKEVPNRPAGRRRFLGRVPHRRQPMTEEWEGAKAEDAVLAPELAERRLAIVLERVVHNLEIWRLLQEAAGMRVHYVLQPVIGWTSKPLTEAEKSSFDNDLAKFPFVRWFARPPIYRQVLDEIKAGADEAGIRFHDANEWLAEEDVTIFGDVCHFSDEGQRLVAEQLDRRLDWNKG
jgi:hypothetical protein